VAAIRLAQSQRPAPKSPADADRVFLTKYGTAWGKADRKTSPLSSEFRKLAKSLELYRPGLSFYSLRHVYETVAGGSKDQVAVNFTMGHVDGSMSREYRDSIEDQRLIDVADHCHKWLYGRKMPKGKAGLRVVG
jgi:integrase